MALVFRRCKSCNEIHAVRAEGRMSVHVTAAGKRCREVNEESGKIGLQEARRRSREQKKNRRQNQSELEQAFAFAHARKRNKSGASGSLDRRIYAIEGVSIVRGGLPGSKR